MDAVLSGPGLKLARSTVLDRKPGNTFPSDHYGVLVDLAWE